jgi:hypothetical protein
VGDDLLIRNNARYYIGGERITRAEALALAAPYPDVVKYMKRGVTYKWTAVGLGIAGPLVALVGLNGAFYSTFGGSSDALLAFQITTYVGGAMTYAAIGFALGSGGAQRKAMRLYNDYNRYGDLAPSDRGGVYLSLGATPGGIGLQFRF